MYSKGHHQRESYLVAPRNYLPGDGATSPDVEGYTTTRAFGRPEGRRPLQPKKPKGAKKPLTQVTTIPRNIYPKGSTLKQSSERAGLPPLLKNGNAACDRSQHKISAPHQPRQHRGLPNWREE